MSPHDLAGLSEADVERAPNGTYICLSCGRAVDADEEPSPGEPVRCPDCHNDVEREGRWEE
jgi:DNA-directed RNA polymerase subunit RPC12/RpoP